MREKDNTQGREKSPKDPVNSAELLSPTDLLDHPTMPLSMIQDEDPGSFNLHWKGVRAGFMDRTRGGRWNMLIILEHPDQSVTQYSAGYRTIEEAVVKLTQWVPTLEGRPVSPAEALQVKAAFNH